MRAFNTSVLIGTLHTSVLVHVALKLFPCLAAGLNVNVNPGPSSVSASNSAMVACLLCRAIGPGEEGGVLWVEAVFSGEQLWQQGQAGAAGQSAEVCHLERDRKGGIVEFVNPAPDALRFDGCVQLQQNAWRFG